MLNVLSFLAPYLTAAIMIGCCIGLFVVAYWTFHDDC
jgi:hypothetical protein